MEAQVTPWHGIGSKWDWAGEYISQCGGRIQPLVINHLNSKIVILIIVCVSLSLKDDKKVWCEPLDNNRHVTTFSSISIV